MVFMLIHEYIQNNIHKKLLGSVHGEKTIERTRYGEGVRTMLGGADVNWKTWNY